MLIQQKNQQNINITQERNLFMQILLNRIRNIPNFAFFSRRRLTWMIIILWLSMSIGFLLHNRTTHSPPSVNVRSTVTRNLALTEELNNIDTRLTVIENQLSHHPDTLNVAELSEKISALSQEMKILLNSSDDNMNQHLQFTTTTLSGELGVVKAAIANLAKQKNQHTLPATQLPFQILHIDMIQEQPVVTVNYNHTNTPLMIGDELVGWKLMSADFSIQQANFRNFKDEWVHAKPSHANQ